jgi:lysophospholipase L1-like esterase
VEVVGGGVEVLGAGYTRRVATAAVVGSTGLTLAGTALWGVLFTEAKLARRWVGTPTTEAPDDDATYGFCEGPAISFAVLGDSSAAGLGCDHPHETPGARIASGLAAIAEVPVTLTNVSKVGAQSTDLAGQVTLALEAKPEVALIMIGVNDVTHRVRSSVAVAQLAEAVRRLRAANCQVVVGTCPDLGTIEPVLQPLRYLARRWSRQLAAAQTIAVVEAGGRTVSLGDLLGPEFSAAPHEMFSPDRFHPSATGYASAAMALLPSVCAALGYWPVEETAPDAARGEGVLSIAEAAVEAVEEPGTEVAPVGAGRTPAGGRSPWALIRHRRREQLPEVVEVRSSAA